MGGTCTNLLVGKVSLSGHLLCHVTLTLSMPTAHV